MNVTAYVLRFLHILSAAVWFGSALSWPGALRRALKLGAPHPAPAVAQARTGLALDLWAGAATVLTGLVYASPLGASRLRLGIVVGLALALARLVLLFALARPTFQLVSDAVGAGNLDQARSASRRVAAYTGVAHLLWLLALVTMVFPI